MSGRSGTQVRAENLAALKKYLVRVLTGQRRMPICETGRSKGLPNKSRIAEECGFDRQTFNLSNIEENELVDSVFRAVIAEETLNSTDLEQPPKKTHKRSSGDADELERLARKLERAEAQKLLLTQEINLLRDEKKRLNENIEQMKFRFQLMEQTGMRVPLD